MKEITNRIFAMQDKAYGDFHAKLIPGTARDCIIGVRIPHLRKLACDIVREGMADTVLQSLPHRYYEENNLHALIISELKDFDTAIAELDKFLPYIDNWGTCDIIHPKTFRKKDRREQLLENIDRWMSDAHPFTIRFGTGMLMAHFLDDGFRTEYLDRAATVATSKHYYVRMMAAWFFATALAKQYTATIPYIEQHRLPIWTHNKTIQKAVESLRITKQQKRYLRSLKINQPSGSEGNIK